MRNTQNRSAEKMTDKERVKEKIGKQALKGGWVVALYHMGGHTGTLMGTITASEACQLPGPQFP